MFSKQKPEPLPQIAIPYITELKIVKLRVTKTFKGELKFKMFKSKSLQTLSAKLILCIFVMFSYSRNVNSEVLKGEQTVIKQIL
jgi:hypothetical protein